MATNKYGLPTTAEETVENLKSWDVKSKGDNVFEFKGLSEDVPLLPKLKNLATGSTAYCVDTASVYMYERTKKEWYEQ